MSLHCLLSTQLNSSTAGKIASPRSSSFSVPTDTSSLSDVSHLNELCRRRVAPLYNLGRRDVTTYLVTNQITPFFCFKSSQWIVTPSIHKPGKRCDNTIKAIAGRRERARPRGPCAPSRVAPASARESHPPPPSRCPVQIATPTATAASVHVRPRPPLDGSLYVHSLSCYRRAHH